MSNKRIPFAAKEAKYVAHVLATELDTVPYTPEMAELFREIWRYYNDKYYRLAFPEEDAKNLN